MICKNCAGVAEWYVWYRGCQICVGGANIMYNHLCSGCLAMEILEGRDNAEVEYAKMIDYPSIEVHRAKNND